MHFGKQNRSDDVFFIKKTSQFNHQSLFRVFYTACCKDFVNFQIDLFIKTDSSLLRSRDHRNSRVRQQQDFEFDYRDMY